MITIRRPAHGSPLGGRYTWYTYVPAVPGALRMGSGARTLNVSTTKGAASAEYRPIQGRAAYIGVSRYTTRVSAPLRHRIRATTASARRQDAVRAPPRRASISIAGSSARHALLRA